MLPADVLTKTRRLVAYDGATVAVDVHADGTVVAEIDRGDGPAREFPPAYDVVREVTDEEEFSGAALAPMMAPCAWGRSCCRASRGPRWRRRSARPRGPQSPSARAPEGGIGYDVAYVADHLTHPTMAGHWLADGFTTLAAAATTTSRIDLGPLVASAAIRNPLTLARAAATIDDISGGRLVLGLGAGTAGDAVADHGTSPTTKELTDRFGDVVHALEAIWAGEPTYLGDHAAYDGSVTSPTAEGRGRPFTMIATHGPRGLALAARYGDAWSTYGGAAAVPLPPDDFWALPGRPVRGAQPEVCGDRARPGRGTAVGAARLRHGPGPVEGRLGVRRRGRARGEPGVRRGRRLLERR